MPAGYGLARFPIPGKEVLFVFLLLGLIVPYQALLTPLFLMFAQLKLHQFADRARHRPYCDPAAVQLYVMRNAFEAVPRELEEAAMMDGCNCFQMLVNLPAGGGARDDHGLAVRLHHLLERVPGALVIMNKDSASPCR